MIYGEDLGYIMSRWEDARSTWDTGPSGICFPPADRIIRYKCLSYFEAFVQNAYYV